MTSLRLPYVAGLDIETPEHDGQDRSRKCERCGERVVINTEQHRAWVSEYGELEIVCIYCVKLQMEHELDEHGTFIAIRHDGSTIRVQREVAKDA
jgi:hypothetical protein